jgi:hypothetical protein
MQADTPLAQAGTGGVMDEPPREPPPQPEPTEPAAPVTTAPEPAPEPTGWIPPPAENKPSRILIRLLAGIAVALLGVLVFTMFIGSQVDPREATATDFGRRLMAMPEFQARYGDVDSPERAYELGQELGATALARLDDLTLLRYWQLTEVVLKNADDSICTQVMRRTIKAEEASELAKTLDEDQYIEFLEVTFKAFEAELKETPGPPPPSDADVQAASIALTNAMGLDAVTKAANALQDTTAEDKAVCDAARAFIGGVLDLQDPHRATFLRFMVAQGL